MTFNESTRMQYDIQPYLDPEHQRGAVWCSVTFTPRFGDEGTRSTCGPDLAGSHVEREILVFDWGVASAVKFLALEDVVSEDYYPILCDALNAQLREHPWAELECPIGKIRVDAKPYAQCYLLRQKSPGSCSTCPEGCG